MIVIALGSNMEGAWGTPRQTVERAFGELDGYPLKLLRASRLLLTAPYGKPNQPTFVNAVAIVDTHLPPLALLNRLQQLERAAGRRRTVRWGPRTLDLDIIDYHSMQREMTGGLRQSLHLPHPGIAERAFVLQPLSEIAPAWRHPVTRRSARCMLRHLPGTAGGSEL
jgi:2-amino-4-hydroxy-6-hydroxymethyldihydropteridine diphosphokinase